MARVCKRCVDEMYVLLYGNWVKVKAIRHCGINLSQSLTDLGDLCAQRWSSKSQVTGSVFYFTVKDRICRNFMSSLSRYISRVRCDSRTKGKTFIKP